MLAGRSLWFVADRRIGRGLAADPGLGPSARTEPGFDQPGAAAWHDVPRRIPVDGRDMPPLYEAASRRLGSLERFASRINRTIPAAQPVTRVWMDGARVVAMGDRAGAAGILDAWTPLGPGNIGGRTRVVKFHPTVPTHDFRGGRVRRHLEERRQRHHVAPDR